MGPVQIYDGKAVLYRNKIAIGRCTCVKDFDAGIVSRTLIKITGFIRLLGIKRSSRISHSLNLSSSPMLEQECRIEEKKIYRVHQCFKWSFNLVNIC